MRTFRWPLAAAACIIAVAGCDNFLEVEQNVEPSSAAIFENDDDFDAALGSAFGVWWGTAQGSRPTNSVWLYPVLALSSLGEELSMNPTTTTGHAYVAQEPRIAYDNDQFGGNWFFRKPYYDLYQCTATATDAIRYLDANPTRVIRSGGTVDHTARARWYARFMLGLCHVYSGILYDQGYVIDESINTQDATQDFLPLIKPYQAVTAHGIKQLEMAIAEMEAATFEDTIPLTWISRTAADPLTKADMIRIAHSFIARGLVYSTRSPQERAGVDWARVTSHLNKGIVEDFWVQGIPTTSSTTTNSSRFDSQYKRYILFQTDGRLNNWLVGPSDTSGAFQAWVAAGPAGRDAFLIKTLDRRIHGRDSVRTTRVTRLDTVSTSPLKVDTTLVRIDTTLVIAGYRRPGTYVNPRLSACSATVAAQRGQTVAVCYEPIQANHGSTTYRRSLYASNRWPSTHWNTGQLITMSLKEMNFIRAEALLRTGSAAAAATLINAQGRTAAGLKPLTVADSTGTRPTCVPRKPNGECGNLMDALMYEKRIETHAIEAIIPFADYRGWGLMPVGTICQLAIPNREAEVIGLATYTFGGSTPGSVGMGPAASGAKCSG